MPGDTFTPKTHPPPASSWWATPCSFAAWTALQQIAQTRISRTGRPVGSPAPVPPLGGQR